MDGGNVHPAECGQGFELFPSLAAPAPDGHDGVGDLRIASSPSPMTKASMKALIGAGLKARGAAGDDQGVRLVPLLTAKRDPAQIEHHQNVRVGEFVLEGEADDVEGGKRPLRLQGAEGQSAAAQLRLHVRPGGVAALAGDLRQPVQDGVEDLEAEVGHPDLIGVGEGEGKAEAAGLRVFPDGIDLAPGVAAGFFDGEQELAGIHCGRIGHVPFSFRISRYR